ncbi:ABC transporter ATP-binding protein [Sphingomonas guangdongensis]|nr:ABC transporter ATP-binding protein [Sphingomonas guangdongensis]
MWGFQPFGDHPHLSALANRFRSAVPVVVVISVLTGLLESAGIGMLIPLLSTLSASTAPPEGRLAQYLTSVAGGLDSSDRLVLIAGFIFMLVVAKNLVATAGGIFSASLYGRIAATICDDLSRRLEVAPFAFHLRADSARLVQILGTESWQAADAARARFARVGAMATALAFGVMLLAIEWRLSLLVLLGAIIARFVQARFEVRLRRMSHRVTERNNHLAARMMFAIFGARVIRAFDQTAAEQARFEASSEQLRRSLFSIERLSGAVWPALETLHALLFLTVLLIAIAIAVPLPVLATFLVLLNRAQPHLRAVEQANGAYAAAAGRLSEVEWLLDPATTGTMGSGSRPFDELEREIRFDRVSFSYETRGEATPVLTELSFTIAKGRSLALLGRSGAGKSTIVNLLCGLLSPTTGRILVDGVPLDELDRSAWLARVAVAGQDLELFDGTIADNIAFGSPSASDADIDQAAERAQAHFIAALPDGMQTQVGDRGTSLSGGQRQRIGIARALLRAPDLLILDEATSAIDRMTEDEIIQVVRGLPAETTVIMISHRTETISHCDDAVLIDEGRATLVPPPA